MVALGVLVVTLFAISILVGVWRFVFPSGGERDSDINSLSFSLDQDSLAREGGSDTSPISSKRSHAPAILSTPSAIHCINTSSATLGSINQSTDGSPVGVQPNGPLRKTARPEQSGRLARQKKDQPFDLRETVRQTEKMSGSLWERWGGRILEPTDTSLTKRTPVQEKEAQPPKKGRSLPTSFGGPRAIHVSSQPQASGHVRVAEGKQKFLDERDIKSTLAAGPVAEGVVPSEPIGHNSSARDSANRHNTTVCSTPSGLAQLPQASVSMIASESTLLSTSAIQSSASVVDAETFIRAFVCRAADQTRSSSTTVLNIRFGQNRCNSLDLSALSSRDHATRKLLLRCPVDSVSCLQPSISEKFVALGLGLYHFSSKYNEYSIIANGILSRSRLDRIGIAPKYVSSTGSRISDSRLGLSNYAHAVFTRDATMAYKVVNDGRSPEGLIWFGISPEVLELPGVLFCRDYANKTGAEWLPITELQDLDLFHLAMKSWRCRYWQVLIPNHISKEFLSLVESSEVQAMAKSYGE